MSMFDKIKSSVADVSQKNNSWVSDASTKTKSSVASVVATKGVLGFLIFLRDTPFSSILKLAKSIVKLIPISGIPIIIMILEMMIKVEWLLDKVLDIIIKDIEKKQTQSLNENLLTT